MLLVVVVMMTLLLLLKCTAYEIKKLLAALNFAADQACAKGKLIFLIDLEGSEVEGWHFGRGHGEGEKKRVDARDVVFKQSGHLVHGDTEAE